MPLAAIDPLWINQLTYDAEELRRNQGFMMTGAANAGTALGGVTDVRALTVSLSSLTVLVGQGGAVVPASKGPYITGLAGSGGSAGNLQAADATNPRRDRVVLCIIDPDMNATGTSRKAEVRLLTGTPRPLAASTGDGYPTIDPDVAAYLDLAYVDVPKAGNGSPVVTDIRTFTVATGAPIPVVSQAVRDGLTKWNGLQVQRLDLSGTVETYLTSTNAWVTDSGVSYSALSPTGYAVTGEVRVEQLGTKRRVTVDITITRTGTNAGFGTAFANFGQVLPSAVLGSSLVKYLVVGLSGNGMNNTATVSLDPATGVMAIRGQSQFTWNQYGLFTFNVSYFI